jgi:GNAT superfamily N-acetyltransferase
VSASVVKIEPLDPFDDVQLSEFHSVYQAADRHGRRYANGWALVEMAAALRSPQEYVTHLPSCIRVDGAMVGLVQVELPQRDNTTLAVAEVHVLPEQRRKGFGTLLAAHAAEQARDHGRTTWTAWVPGRDVDEPADTRTPGEHFATAHCMRLGQREVQRRLALPAPVERLERLAAQAAERHDDYRLVGWVGHCPDEHVAAYCRLKAAMNTEAPSGELEVEDQHWDERRLRQEEERMRASGRTVHVCVAVAPDGSLAGHNELVVPAHDPEVVFQWDTLVLPVHRGHRLGIALKVRNLLAVQAAHPGRTNLRTFNADSNTHMVAINDAIGFVPVAYMGEWLGPVPA